MRRHGTRLAADLASVMALVGLTPTVWPLKPGMYDIRFLVDDSYRSIAASANFKIVKP